MKLLYIAFAAVVFFGAFVLTYAAFSTMPTKTDEYERKCAGVGGVVFETRTKRMCVRESEVHEVTV